MLCQAIEKQNNILILVKNEKKEKKKQQVCAIVRNISRVRTVERQRCCQQWDSIVLYCIGFAPYDLSDETVSIPQYGTLGVVFVW